MIDSDRYMIERLAGYPQERWRVALTKFPPPSSRPPGRFWRDQRDRAIAWLRGYDVDVAESCGVVSVDGVEVDGSYVNAYST